MTLMGKTVLVTGGTGFIGGRVVERLLLEEGVRVKVLVRSFSSAVWLSRSAAELILGDITEPKGLLSAVSGCDVIIHCAAALGGDADLMERINVAGTSNLIAAAHDADVSRFVHVSSLAVHGRDLPDAIDETSPLQPERDAYGQTKLAAERLVLQHFKDHGLSVVILRPSIVYGPRSQWWTTDLVQRIKENHLALVGKGEGVANVVYVDDVVTALLTAANTPGIDGECFLISTDERITWREFFGAYGTMLNRQLPKWPYVVALVVANTINWVDQLIDRIRGDRDLVYGMRLVMLVGLHGLRKILFPLNKLSRQEVSMFVGKEQINVAKANQLLEYRSRWTLSEAMAETETWLRSQGYFPFKN